jgi:hypothetical protein
VFETIRIVRAKLPHEVTLLGFCGAPWTVATYMVAGCGTPEARRWRDVCAQITADLGGEPLSEAQRQLVRRATTIAVQCEVMEAEAANGREIDLDTYGQLTDRLDRVLSRLGIKRQPRDVTPDLRTYIAQKREASP